MTPYHSCLAIVVAALFASQAFGQVVQLPTFNSFSVSTTVSVPDSGRGFAGGISRARSGSISRGIPVAGKLPVAGPLFKDRGIGHSVSASGVSVHATIIDLDEMDKAVLREAALRRSYREGTPFDATTAVHDYMVDRKATFLNKNVARGPFERVPAVEEAASPRVESVEEIRRQNELARLERDAKAVEYFEQGQAAEAAGRKGAARVYYNMAARRADGDFQQEILLRLAALNGKPASEKLAAHDN